MIMIIKIFLLFCIISVASVLIMGFITYKIDKKPKSNKFRQWWSRHIVDLDNKYHD
jgi:hypothetical protein